MCDIGLNVWKAAWRRPLQPYSAESKHCQWKKYDEKSLVLLSRWENTSKNNGWVNTGLLLLVWKTNGEGLRKIGGEGMYRRMVAASHWGGERDIECTMLLRWKDNKSGVWLEMIGADREKKENRREGSSTDFLCRGENR